MRNQLNPDVTIRSRGVMERCSFCIQRIRRAELKVERQERAKLDYKTMKERNFLPACVMSCPTNALKFADQDDATGPVHEYFEEANHLLEERHHRTERVEEAPTRVYRLLEEMGTKPNVIYLKKVDMFPLGKDRQRGG
jgi:molybdopterin-containing oxidoreductase family iron-sulfur binding subunit